MSNILLTKNGVPKPRNNTSLYTTLGLLCEICGDDYFEAQFEKFCTGMTQEEITAMVNGHPDNEEPYIFKCVKLNKHKAFSLLIKHGSKLKFESPMRANGSGPPIFTQQSLLDCCAHNQVRVDMLKAVMATGADPDNKDGALTHPLRWFKDRPGLLRIMFDHGSSLDEMDRNISEFFPSQDRMTSEIVRNYYKQFIAQNIQMANQDQTLAVRNVKPKL